ncbi:transposase [Wolbachia endosymbiont (group B) of Myelois circumvoluta]
MNLLLRAKIMEYVSPSFNSNYSMYALKSGYQWRMLPKEFPKTAQLL